MWKIAYNVAVLLALPFFTALALFKKKLRANFTERLFPAAAHQDISGGIWIHAASVGEAVIAENLVHYISQNSEEPFVVTTNTYYTRDLLRKKLHDPIEIYSAPLDLPFSISRFVGARRFEALLIIETELWPNVIWMAKARGIPVIIVNGRISDSTVNRYRRLSFFLRSLLKSVDLVLAQSEEHARRFVSLGLLEEKVIVTGNLKYYREINDLPDSPVGERAVTFGSIRENEVPILIPVIEGLANEYPDLRFYVAPRELRLVDEIEKELPPGITACRYSRCKHEPSAADRIVIVDTMGDLLRIYAGSKVAFVGGSLAPYGGQNLLEPLFVQTPVIFGPSVENFKGVADSVLSHGAGVMVQDGNQLLSTIKTLLNDEPARQKVIDAGRIVINLQKDAMDKTAQSVLETIWKNSRSSSG